VTGAAPTPPRRRLLLDSLPVLLFRTAHPRQAVLTAAGLAAVAALDARPGREVALVAATVLVGQAVLGWHNDLVDRARDRRHERSGKPIADGRLDPGTAWFAWCCGVLLLVPLAVNNGVLAGSCYLASVAIGLLGNIDNGLVRRGLLSWLPWAVGYGLYPAFLSYGGWGGQAEGDPPQPALIGIAALVGVCVHFLTALWGLVADDADGWTYLPLRVGRRLGATRLLVLTLVCLAASVAAFGVVAHQLGLAR
jgi:4-hydroxybenzoate polyprenyltransferase